MGTLRAHIKPPKKSLPSKVKKKPTCLAQTIVTPHKIVETHQVHHASRILLALFLRSSSFLFIFKLWR
jgi:hypothetical protein